MGETEIYINMRLEAKQERESQVYQPVMGRVPRVEGGSVSRYFPFNLAETRASIFLI